MRKLLALFLPLVLLLTSCGSFMDEVRDELASELEYDYSDDYDWDEWEDALWLSDFDDVCQGAPNVNGTAYTQEPGSHPVAIFDRDSSYEDFYNTSYILPEVWEASYDEPETTELVVCLTTVPGEFVEACEYDIEGETYILNNYTAAYTTELYEATTGALVDSTTLELPAEECPMYWYFFDLTEDYYPTYDQPLTDWIKPYVQI